MKALLGLLLGALMSLAVILPSGAWALELGTDITIYDGSSSAETGWYGQNEDDEVEPGCLAGQEWDLEGFFLDGTTLSAVGGFDFVNGYNDYAIGDIFIDIDGIYYPNAGSSADGNFGYEYVLSLDTESMTYDVYDISSGATVETVQYSSNELSNPFKYVSGGTKITSGTFTYWANLADSDVNGLEGDEHYAITGFDLGFIAGQNFTAHLTMECGNDNLMGNGTPVPEPATMVLMGSGLVLIGRFGKRKLKKG